MNTTAMERFITYVDNRIVPAMNDVNSLTDESRKHVQRLIYTNLVNRFDAMIDGTILENPRCDFLLEKATGRMNQPIIEADLVKLLMHSEDIQTAIDEKLRITLRSTVLRDRHSKKLATLFAAFNGSSDVMKKPRVNISTGDIIEKIKPHHKTIPYSICGYADWLYSKRNSIVHGGSINKFLENDRKQIKKLYKCEVAQTHRIRLSSSSVTTKFYKGVVHILMQ